MKHYKLRDIATIYNGNSINKTEKKQKYMNDVPGWNYIGTKDIDFDGTVTYKNGVVIPYSQSKFRIAPAGTILVCSEGGSAGRKTAIITEDVCFGNKLFAIINDKGMFFSKYIYYYTRYSGFTKQFKLLATSLMGGISGKNFGTIEVPLPTLEKQQQIVTRIEELFSELDKGVETLQTIKQQLAVYRQAIYHTAYTNIKHKQSITNFFEISGGLTKNSKRGELPLKYPYLRVANVYYNHLDLSEIREIGVTENEVDRTTLHQDDLLFVEGNGSKSQIGRVAIWDGSIPNCLHQNHLIKGRPLGNILPKYALFYLISKEGRKQITDIAKSTSGLYTLSTNKIKSLTIPYCNLDEQKNIVQEIESRLSVCDSIEQTVNTALSQAEAMRQSILKKAFEGTL